MHVNSFVSLCFLCFRFHGNLGYKEALLVSECCYVSDAVVLADLKDGTNTIDQTLLLHVDQWNYSYNISVLATMAYASTLITVICEHKTFFILHKGTKNFYMKFVYLY